MPSVWPPPPYGHALGAIYSHWSGRIVIPPRASIFEPPMNAHLTDRDRAELAHILRDVIQADRFPFSRKVKRWKEQLSKLDPARERIVTPYPPPKPSLDASS